MVVIIHICLLTKMSITNSSASLRLAQLFHMDGWGHQAYSRCLELELDMYME